MEAKKSSMKKIPPLRGGHADIMHGASVATSPSTTPTTSPTLAEEADGYNSKLTPLLAANITQSSAEVEQLTRKIFSLGDPRSPSPPLPRDDFGPYPTTHEKPGQSRRSMSRKSCTPLEAALPALVTKSPECKLYAYRYIILAMFCLLSMSNSYQWLQYSIIQNVIVEYYGVSPIAVDWTSMLFMVTYIPLIFPATWLLNKWGLRRCILIGASLNCLGACVKCFSAAPQLFLVTFIGQTLTSIGQIFILGTPTQLAAVWFGPREVSTACAVGVFGNQIGIAIGFVLPPQLVRSFTENAIDREREVELIGTDLFWLFCGCAVATFAIFVLLIFFFRDAPPHPPSFAQARNLVSNANDGMNDADLGISSSGESGINYGHDLKQLLTSRNFLLLLASYGINTGIYYAIGTRLNYIILHYFPGKEREAGLIGLTIILSGLIGSVICGIILDKTKKFKATTATIYFLSLVATFGFAFLLNLQNLLVAFVIAAALGFFMTGYLPVGFEFAVELTYPVQEGMSSGLLNASAQLFGMIITILLGVLQPWNVFYSNAIMGALLMIGFLLTMSIRGNVLKRSQASTMFSDMILNSDFVGKQGKFSPEESKLLARNRNCLVR